MTTTESSLTPDVRNGIDFKVAGGPDLQVENPVDGNKREHVVKKRNPRIQLGPSGSIKLKLDGNLSLPGISCHGANSFDSHKRPACQVSAHPETTSPR